MERSASTLTIEHFVHTLKTDLESGLSLAEVQKRQAEHGLHILPEEPPPSRMSVLWHQFESPLIYVLVVAVVITLALRDYSDALVIAFAVTLNTVIGFVQEFRAQNTIHLLKRMYQPQAIVLRDGKRYSIETSQLVVGDLVELKPGNRVPADVRLCDVAGLRINESVLTGESAPVEKNIELLPKKMPLADQRNMAFWGTEVVSGSGRGLVVHIGLETELGKVAVLINSVKDEKTPLQVRLEALSKSLALFVGAACFVIFGIGILSGRGIIEMFTTAVALAVAAIPEGLVIGLTVILALGMERIYKQKALVRRMVSAETLGSTTVICTDKTGTLTEGRMQVTKEQVEDKDLAVMTSLLCNDLISSTEIAIWEDAEGKISKDSQHILKQYPRIDSYPFSSEWKFMATLNRYEGQTAGFFKGAPEVILNFSDLAEKQKVEIRATIDQWAMAGLRILALGYKVYDKSTYKLPSTISSIKWIGLIGLSDPLRKDVKSALQACQRAGIRVMVITGDYRETAEAVMRGLGISLEEGSVMDGQELARLSEADLEKRVDDVKLFARVNPEDKLKIVEALQRRGEVVAMMGDGINDAPALKRADIGIVVGDATEVARETADMVLLDNSFGTIVSAVEEGRAIFDNLRKILLYLLSGSFSEVCLVLGALIIGLVVGSDFPIPLLAAQILWINLVSDGLPYLALTLDPKDPQVMQEKPKDPKQSLLDWEIKSLAVIVSIFAGLSALIMFIVALHITQDIALTRTLVFITLGMESLLYVFSCRNLRRSVVSRDAFNNPWLIGSVVVGFLALLAAVYMPLLQNILQTVPLRLSHWLVPFGISIVVVGLIELMKFYLVIRRRQHVQV